MAGKRQSVRGGALKGCVIILVCGLALVSAKTAGGESGTGKKIQSSRALRSMGRVYMAGGDYAKAQPLLERALFSARAEGICGSELCLCLTDLAYLYTRQGRLAEAEEMCRRGLKLQEKIYYKYHPHIAYTLRTLGSIYRRQERYGQARGVLDRAMEIMERSHRPDDEVLVPFQMDIAKLSAAEGDFVQAEKQLEKALAIVRKTGDAAELERLKRQAAKVRGAGQGVYK